MSKQYTVQISKNTDVELSSQAQLSVVVPQFYREGYTLKYWKDAEGNIYTDTININSNKTISAVWEIEEIDNLIMKSIYGKKCIFDAAVSPINKKLGYIDSSKNVLRPFNLCVEISDFNTVESVDDIKGDISSVNNQAFKECSNLKSIKCNAATEINSYVFLSCINLTSVEFQSAETVGNQSFCYCINLSSIDLPNVTSIGAQSFVNCSSLISINCPYVTSIGGNSFNNCSSLTSINIPNVNSVNYGTFLNCENLLMANISSAISINNQAFKTCKNLSSINCTSITTIGEQSFSLCKNLTSINCPSVSSIGNQAFSDCLNLSSIILSSITDEPTSIGSNVFRSCPVPVSVYLKNDEMISKFKENTNWLNLYTSGKVTFIPVEHEEQIRFLASNNEWQNFSYSDISVYQGNTGTLNYRDIDTSKVIQPFLSNSALSSDLGSQQYISNVVEIDILDQNIRKIGDRSFYFCNKISSVNMPYVKITGWRSFYRDQNLLSVNIPDAQNLQYGSFYNCYKLSTINTTDKLEKIGDYAFQDCAKISSIYCNNVSSLGAYVFLGCTQLSSLTLGNITSVGVKTFERCNRLSSLILSSISEVPTVDLNSFGIRTYPVSVYVKDNDILQRFENNTNWNQLQSENKVKLISLEHEDM